MSALGAHPHINAASVRGRAVTGQKSSAKRTPTSVHPQRGDGTTPSLDQPMPPLELGNIVVRMGLPLHVMDSLVMAGLENQIKWPYSPLDKSRRLGTNGPD